MTLRSPRLPEGSRPAHALEAPGHECDRLAAHPLAHILHTDNNFAGQNKTGSWNAEMDKSLETIEVELDSKKRRAMRRRLQEINADELPVLPLYFRANSASFPSG